MARFVNPLNRLNFVDANILDDVADGEDGAVNELVRLTKSEVVRLALPYSVKTEVKHPNTPPHVKRAANDFLCSEEVALTEPERNRYRDLLVAAIGDAAVQNIAADLFHVCEAAKYGGYFITRDKRLLNRSDVIRRAIDAEVITPSEFLARIDEAKRRARALEELR